MKLEVFKNQVFEKINKNDKALAGLIKKKKESSSK